ncbi:MAG: hypothetical protein EA396_02715 [Anaerolineaceae bacterium]|nr:MAG: hypothetical protein EA396_02715 [Anaerolineaceae bacterium]
MNHSTDTIEEIQSALRFTPDDLPLNRDGRLSEWQIYHLRVRRRRSILLGVGLVLALAFVATLFIYAGGFIRLLIGVGITLCMAFLLASFAGHWMRLTADIRSGQALKREGQLQRVILPVTRRVHNYALRIDDQQFMVSKYVLDLFEHQAHYALYFTPHTAQIISAEMLAGAGSAPCGHSPE